MRSDLVADDEYVQAMDPRLTSVQMSISSINRELTRQLEPGAPAPNKRLQALQKLAEHGLWTTVRINPLFPIYPDGYYTDPHFDHSQPITPFNFFSWDMIEAIAQHHVPTVLVGMARLYRPNLHFMRKALRYDVRTHFADDVRIERASLHFSTAETAYYLQKSSNCVTSTGCVSRPAISATTLLARVFTAINRCGVTAPIAVTRSATCRPARPRAPRCRSSQPPDAGVHTHVIPSTHAARPQHPGSLGAGHRVWA